MKKSIFACLSVALIAQAVTVASVLAGDVRTVTKTCSGVDTSFGPSNGLTSLYVRLQTKFDAQAQMVSVNFGVAVNGVIDGESGTLGGAGQSVLRLSGLANTDPAYVTASNIMSAHSYSVTSPNGNSLSVKLLSEALNDSQVPGYIYTMNMMTDRPTLASFVLKAVSSGANSMTGNLYIVPKANPVAQLVAQVEMTCQNNVE